VFMMFAIASGVLYKAVGCEFGSALLYASPLLIFSKSALGFEREPYPLEMHHAFYDEAALEPSRRIIDCHHHLWDARAHPKGWPVPQVVINAIYLLKPPLINLLMNANLRLTGKANVLSTFSFWNPMVCVYMTDEFMSDICGTHGDEYVAQFAEEAIQGQEEVPRHNIMATVYIESGWKDPKVKDPAMASIGEAVMAKGADDATIRRVCTGIVAHVDLRLGAAVVEPALVALKEQTPTVCGIRHALACPDPTDKRTLRIMPALHAKDTDTASSPAFREAFALLAKHGLTYDCWLYDNNLESLADLAKAFPETTIIVDHCGGPVGVGETREATLARWTPRIQALAKHKNVVCKLSGLGMVPVGLGLDDAWTEPASSEALAELWRPFLLVCIEAFGVDRCMFASNFPIDKVSCSYTVLWNAFKRVTQKFSDSDKDKLFYENARRVYSLDVYLKPRPIVEDD